MIGPEWLRPTRDTTPAGLAWLKKAQATWRRSQAEADDLCSLQLAELAGLYAELAEQADQEVLPCAPF